jgi:hypothetical protein
MSVDNPNVAEVERAILAVLEDNGDPLNENGLRNYVSMRFRANPDRDVYDKAIGNLMINNTIRWVAFRGFAKGGRP